MTLHFFRIFTVQRLKTVNCMRRPTKYRLQRVYGVDTPQGEAFEESKKKNWEQKKNEILYLTFALTIVSRC